MFCQKIFSPKRSFAKTEECFPRNGRGDEPSSTHLKRYQNGDDLFVFLGHLFFTWREWCLAKRERDSSSFLLVVIAYTVVNTPGDIPAVSPPIFPRTIFHNLFFEQKNLFLFSEKMKFITIFEYARDDWMIWTVRITGWCLRVLQSLGSSNVIVSLITQLSFSLCRPTPQISLSLDFRKKLLVKLIDTHTKYEF